MVVVAAAALVNVRGCLQLCFGRRLLYGRETLERLSGEIYYSERWILPASCNQVPEGASSQKRVREDIREGAVSQALE